MKKLWMGLLLAVGVISVNADSIYSADFSVAGQGSTHDNTGSDPIETSPVSGENWTLTFGSVSSDGSKNEFITVSGVMRVQDWGGEGTLTSDSINIAESGTIVVTGSALSIGGNAFNAGGEGITWFYQINSEAQVTHTIADALTSGTDVGYSFSGIPVTAGDVLKIGFTVNVDGADDGVEVSALTVDFTVTPTSSGIDLRAFQTSEGAVVEFVAYDVEADGSIELALMDENDAVVWQGEVEATEGPRFFARFLVPGLELGESYRFLVRDEVGKWWEADGVTVEAFATEMTSASLAGITLNFDSQPDRDYDIQWVPTLGSAWQTVTNITASGAQTEVVVAHPDPEGRSGFFRVQLK